MAKLDRAGEAKRCAQSDRQGVRAARLSSCSRTVMMRTGLPGREGHRTCWSCLCSSAAAAAAFSKPSKKRWRNRFQGSRSVSLLLGNPCRGLGGEGRFYAAHPVQGDLLPEGDVPQLLVDGVGRQIRKNTMRPAPPAWCPQGCGLGELPRCRRSGPALVRSWMYFLVFSSMATNWAFFGSCLCFQVRREQRRNLVCYLFQPLCASNLPWPWHRGKGVHPALKTVPV